MTVHPLLAFVVMLLLGLLVGLVGTSGSLLIPVLVIIFGMEQRVAQGTAILAATIPIGILTFIPYFRNGNYDLRLALLAAIGLSIGGYVGATIAQGTSVLHLRWALCAILAVAMGRLLLTR